MLNNFINDLVIITRYRNHAKALLDYVLQIQSIISEYYQRTIGHSHDPGVALFDWGTHLDIRHGEIYN